MGWVWRDVVVGSRLCARWDRVGSRLASDGAHGLAIESPTRPLTPLVGPGLGRDNVTVTVTASD